jgi:V/A-type H+-transporting ATPase subunit C
MKLIVTIASFAYPNAKFNAMGNIYVNYNELEQLTAQGSVQSATEHVSNRYYPLKNLEKIEQIELKIFNAEQRFFKDVYQTVPKPLKPLMKCYLLKWESRYLKSLLAEKMTAKKSRLEPEFGLPEVEFSNEVWLKLKAAPNLSEVMSILTNTRYHIKIKKALERSPVDYSEIEQLLDEIFYNELNSLKSRLKSSVAKPVTDFINLTNDIANVKILLRSKFLGLNEARINKLLLPPGKQLPKWKITELENARSIHELIQILEGTDYYQVLEKKFKNYQKAGDIQVLELALERYYLNEIVNLSIEASLTVGPAIRFIISKEYETRNLITILRGLGRRVPSENILSLTVYEKRTART